MSLGFAVVGHGRVLDIADVLLAEVEPLVGLVDVVPLEGVELDVPDPVVDVVPGVVVDVVVPFVEEEVAPEGDVFELADGFALVPGNGSQGMIPFGAFCGTGVAVLAGGVAVCGAGDAV